MLLYAYELKDLPVPASRSVSQLRCHMQALILQYTTQHKLYKESMFYGYFCVFKGIVHSLTNGIIYSPMCCSKPVWLSVYFETQREVIIMLFSMKLYTMGSFLASKGMPKQLSILLQNYTVVLYRNWWEFTKNLPVPWAGGAVIILCCNQELSWVELEPGASFIKGFI